MRGEITNTYSAVSADSSTSSASDHVRRARIEALVDSGVTYLCLPKPLIEQLGLHFQRTKEARTVTGPLSLGIYGVAKLHVQGRDCITEVMESPADRLPLLGHSARTDGLVG